jgi:dipeptidyl aminopeptidase/acylaminoacyl peptidase
MFSSLGTGPFLDYIYTVQTDGSNVQPLLSPEGGRSYKYASGNSLQSDLAVTVHEKNSAGAIENHLYTYNPASRQWQPLVTEGSVGEALMSPDNSKIAFVLGSDEDLGSFWIMDLKNRERRKLTNNDKDSEAWYAYGSWRPDSQETAFLRLRRTATGVETTLMSSRLTSGATTILLGAEAGVTAVCYSPDGTRLAAFTSRGLEIVKLPGLERVVIVPQSSFGDGRSFPGSLIWSRTQDLIAFSLRNEKLAQAQLWTVSDNGSNLRQIYNQKDARITATSFIAR